MMKISQYLEARLPDYSAVEVEGRLYNRPAPDGAFLTDFSNMRRFRGGRSDQIKDPAMTIPLIGPAVPTPAPYNATKRGIRHETGGDWYGRSARVYGHMLADGSIEVERLEFASPEWEKWNNQQRLREVNRGIYEKQIQDPELSDTMRSYAQNWLDRDESRDPSEDPEPEYADPLGHLKPMSYSPMPVVVPKTRRRSNDIER